MSAYAAKFFPATRLQNSNIQGWPTQAIFYGPGTGVTPPPPPPDDWIDDTTGSAIQDTSGAGLKEA